MFSSATVEIAYIALTQLRKSQGLKPKKTKKKRRKTPERKKGCSYHGVTLSQVKH